MVALLDQGLNKSISMWGYFSGLITYTSQLKSSSILNLLLQTPGWRDPPQRQEAQASCLTGSAIIIIIFFVLIMVMIIMYLMIMKMIIMFMMIMMMISMFMMIMKMVILLYPTRTSRTRTCTRKTWETTASSMALLSRLPSSSSSKSYSLSFSWASSFSSLHHNSHSIVTIRLTLPLVLLTVRGLFRVPSPQEFPRLAMK